MKNLRCPACGAPLKNGSEKCAYCDAYIIKTEREDEKEKAKETEQQIEEQITENLNKFFSNFVAFIKKKREFSMFWFILLLIFLPPIGILYLLFSIFVWDKED